MPGAKGVASGSGRIAPGLRPIAREDGVNALMLHLHQAVWTISA